MLLYDLYFDDVNPPLIQVLAESFQNCYGIPFTLPKYKTYYWRVDTYDKMGEFTEGFVWSFTCGDNNPPTDPIIDGKKTGKPNTEYSFTFVSIDPEGEAVMFNVNWGDNNTEWTEYGDSGVEVTLKHTWTSQGTFTIKAQAIDIHGAESEWAEFIVTMPRDKAVTVNMLLLRIFVRFPLLQKLIQQQYWFGLL
jgi:hypothetical protein